MDTFERWVGQSNERGLWWSFNRVDVISCILLHFDFSLNIECILQLHPRASVWPQITNHKDIKKLNIEVDDYSIFILNACTAF